TAPQSPNKPVRPNHIPTRNRHFRPPNESQDPVAAVSNRAHRRRPCSSSQLQTVHKTKGKPPCPSQTNPSSTPSKAPPSLSSSPSPSVAPKASATSAASPAGTAAPSAPPCSSSKPSASSPA